MDPSNKSGGTPGITRSSKFRTSFLKKATPKNFTVTPTSPGVGTPLKNTPHSSPTSKRTGHKVSDESADNLDTSPDQQRFGLNNALDSGFFKDLRISPQSPSTKGKNSEGEIHKHGEDVIVTPFAQILATLQNIRNSFILLTKLPIDKLKTTAKESSAQIPQVSDENYVNVASDTLNEFDWCLNQLETLQTHRSVSDMASNKFKKMLNDELNHFSQTDKEGNEVTEFLCSTFLDNNEQELDSTDDLLSQDQQGTTLQEDDDYPDREDVKESSTPRTMEWQQDTDSRLPPSKATATTTKLNSKPSTSSSSAAAAAATSTLHQHKSHTPPSGAPKIWNSPAPSNANFRPSSLAAKAGASTRHSPDAIRRKSSYHINQLTNLGTCKSFNVISPIMGFNPIHIKIHTFPNGVPKYGVRVPDEGALSSQLKEIDKWGMDIFKLHELSCHRPLTCLTYSILKQRKLIEIFRVPLPNLINFLMCIEDHYLDIPYHNRIHAADVTQSTHYLLSNSCFEKVFTDLEMFAMIIASAIHDVDHPGFTNQFLINSCSDLAIIYNDEAVLENHHLAIAFKILQEPNCDIFINLSPKKRTIIRRLIIDLVLATDMTKHMKLLADLKTMVETKKLSGVGTLALDGHSDRNLVLQAMIHCGDLSNPTKPLNIYVKWTDLIMTEYFTQGEREKQCGLAVSAMCDKDTASVEKSQIGFMDYIVQPLWETWGDLVYPDCQDILNNLESNREYFENLISEKDYDKRKSLPYNTPFHSMEELRDSNLKHQHHQ